MGKSIHDVKVGSTLQVGEAMIRIERKSGQVARLVVIAPDHILVSRQSDAHECVSHKEPEHGKHTV